MLKACLPINCRKCPVKLRISAQYQILLELQRAEVAKLADEPV